MALTATTELLHAAERSAGLPEACAGHERGRDPLAHADVMSDLCAAPPSMRRALVDPAQGSDPQFSCSSRREIDTRERAELGSAVSHGANLSNWCRCTCPDRYGLCYPTLGRGPTPFSPLPEGVSLRRGAYLGAPAIPSRREGLVSRIGAPLSKAARRIFAADDSPRFRPVRPCGAQFRQSGFRVRARGGRQERSSHASPPNGAALLPSIVARTLTKTRIPVLVGATRNPPNLRPGIATTGPARRADNGRLGPVAQARIRRANGNPYKNASTRAVGRMRTFASITTGNEAAARSTREVSDASRRRKMASIQRG